MAENIPILIHQTDLFHPHGDPDDHFDLATLYSMAQSYLLELADVIIDYPPPHRVGDPDVMAVTQLNYITGLNVPIHIGTPCGMKHRNDLQPEQKQHSAIENIAQILKKSTSPVYITVVGSATDVAIAGKKYPALFKEKCGGIYLNSGSAVKYTGEGDAAEYNVKLNKSAYAAIFDIPCPIYWFPCYHIVKPNWVELAGKNGTVYSFNQGEIFNHISKQLQNYFLYMLKKSDDPKYLRYINQEVDLSELDSFNILPRRMWSTASFLQIIGKSVDKHGNLVDSGSPDSIIQMKPIKITCDDEGQTEWDYDNNSNDRFIFEIVDNDNYNSAMIKALADILKRIS